MPATDTVARPNRSDWKELVARFQTPSIGRGLWQMANTLIPYAALWYLIYLTRGVSWFLTIPLAILAGAFLVRVFIIFHDCAHGCYFKSAPANDTVGILTGILVFTSFHHWRRDHAIHHATSGHLDKRGIGDIWTMTVEEYLEASRWKRLGYRLVRNPFVLFLLAPIFLFLIRQRFPASHATARERNSVSLINLAILGMAIGMSLVFGWQRYMVIQLVILMVAGGTGLWLFYVQHQFEHVYWERGENWDYTDAALRGSSFYKLPGLLRWFSGNIGFHHIHHLSARLPNYYLARCHYSDPLFQQVKPVTLCSSLKSLRYRLWDERHGRLIGYRELRKCRVNRKNRSEDRRDLAGC